MKKLILLISILFVCITVFAVNSNDEFINALRNCSTYSNSGNLTVDGMSVKSNRQIIGWQDDRCVYNENISFSGIDTNISCKFSKSQIQEIISVADAYYYTLQYTRKNPDTSSLDDAKNNPVSNVFSKYLQDSSVCNITSLQ